MNRTKSLLNQLYYDPKTGFISINKLYKKANAIDSSITLKQTREWYKIQPLIQRFSIARKRNQSSDFKIASNNPNEWQMDLAFWNKAPILITVNINSRIGYAELLKDKRADTVLSAINRFINSFEVSALMSDNGSEFTNKKVESFLIENDILHANSIPGDHRVLGKIDRFIRTIKSRLTKMHEAGVFKKLTSRVLNNAIENYNNTEHSAIKATPASKEGQVIYEEVEHNKRLAEQVTSLFPSGSPVRYKLDKTRFAKEGPSYSKTVYEVIGLDGLKIRLRSKNNRILFKSPNELKLVDAEISNHNSALRGNTWEVERILNHSTLRGKVKYLVKWKGYNEPTWEPQSNLRLVNKSKMSDIEKDYFQLETKI